jgi:hypothetical protein
MHVSRRALSNPPSHRTTRFLLGNRFPWTRFVFSWSSAVICGRDTGDAVPSTALGSDVVGVAAGAGGRQPSVCRLLVAITPGNSIAGMDFLVICGPEGGRACARGAAHEVGFCAPFRLLVALTDVLYGAPLSASPHRRALPLQTTRCLALTDSG